MKVSFKFSIAAKKRTVQKPGLFRMQILTHEGKAKYCRVSAAHYKLRSIPAFSRRHRVPFFLFPFSCCAVSASWPKALILTLILNPNSNHEGSIH